MEKGPSIIEWTPQDEKMYSGNRPTLLRQGENVVSLHLNQLKQIQA